MCFGLASTTGSLLAEDRDGAVPAVLPQRQQEGEGRAVQQRRTPVLPLLLGVNQLQDHMQAAPLAQQELLTTKTKG